MNVNGNFNLPKIQIPGLGMPQGETPSVTPESPTSDITLPGEGQDVEPGFAPEEQPPSAQSIRDWWEHQRNIVKWRREIDEMAGVAGLGDLYKPIGLYRKEYWQKPMGGLDEDRIIEELKKNTGF